MTSLQTKVGGRIRAFRNAKGYSIEELAHLADLNAVHLASLERGEKNATLATLEKIVTVLDISFQTLFAFEEAVPAPIAPSDERIVSLLRFLSEEDKEFVSDIILYFTRRNPKQA